MVVAAALAASLSGGNVGGALAAGAAEHAVALPRSLGPGQTGPRSAVPWRRVGAGWVLAEYWPGRYASAGTPRAAAATLYLIDPAGGRYRLYRWPVTKNPPFLVDWSGDKARALVSLAGALEQVVLATGRVLHFRLAGQAQVVGYARPLGHALLGWRQAGSRFQLSRYRLTGGLAKVLVTSADDLITVAVYSPAGNTLAVAARHGVQLVSDRGGVIRTLSVPHTSNRCLPMRWWNSSMILASCQASDTSRSRLWLVPADGGKPAALTPQRGRQSPDHGDIGAWHLPGGLYLQALASSGSARIFRQTAHQQVIGVSVPRTAGNNWILTARGRRLLLAARTPCHDSASLLWFNPSTRYEQTLFKTPRNLAGVLGVVPYGQPTADFHILVSCAASTG